MSLTTISSLPKQQREVLKLKVKIERERRRRAFRSDHDAPDDWQSWLRTLFPGTFTAAFADRHITLWQWIETIELGTKPSPSAFIDVQPRGGGKTTTAESATVRLGAKGVRKFVLYVRSTQDKANESIQSISDKLERKSVAAYYPSLASRKLSKYGHSKGWRVDVLRCANDFNVVGLGLDAAVRGVKLDDYRPDLIIFDDIDNEHDSLITIKKKIDVITKSILPAGAGHCAYLVSQNVIHANGIVNSIVEGTADFLHDRIVSGPHKAVDGLTYEAREQGGYRITGGVATWAGQSLAICEAQMNEWGLAAFLRESQQDVEESGGIWDHIEFRHIDHRDLPDLVHGAVWCDPAVTATDESDANGIAAGGVDGRGNVYLVYAWEQIDTPLNVIKRAMLKAIEYGFGDVGVETDQGGDTWKSVFYQAWREIVESDEYPHVIDGKVLDARRKLVEGEHGQPLDQSARIESGIAVAPGFDYSHEYYELRDGEWWPLKRPSFRGAKAGAGHGSKVERNQRMLTDYEKGQVIHVRGTHAAAEKALRRFSGKPLDLADALYWLWYHLSVKRRRSVIG